MMRGKGKGRSGGAAAGLQQAMEHPNYTRATGAFAGQARTYTRHVLYRQDEGDFDANMHDEDVAAAWQAMAAAGAAPLDMDDPYAEAGLSIHHEEPGAISQFRTDLHSPYLQSLVQRNLRLGGGGDGRGDGSGARNEPRPVTQTAEQRRLDQERTRAEIARAMEQARSQQSVLDPEFAAAVPPQVRRKFLATPEAEDVCQQLVPMLLAAAAGAGALVTEWQLRRILCRAGCDAPATAETRPAAPGHALPLRLFTALLPPHSYQVRVACDLLLREDTSGGSSDESANVLRFRAFQFLPRQ